MIREKITEFAVEWCRRNGMVVLDHTFCGVVFGNCIARGDRGRMIVTRCDPDGEIIALNGAYVDFTRCDT